MRVRHLVFALLLAAAGATASAAAMDGAYRIQLDPSAAVDRTDAIAAELAATYGGSVEPSESATGQTIVLRLTPAKARELAADPRVKSLAPLRARNNAVVEPVNWSAGVAYTYDGSGNMSAIGADEFLYDDAGRVVKAKINNTTREYSYDAFGNRTNCNQVSPSAACQFGYGINSNNNHLTGAITYDSAGSGDVTILGPHHYDYDAEGLLVSDSGTEFLYTAHDERLATISGGLWRWSIRDGRGRTLRVFTSQDGSAGIGASGWQWQRDYVWRDALLLASRQKVEDAITTYHYHLDHLGTPRRVTDQSDEIVGFHDYYAYGPEVSGGLSEPSRAELRYTGHERDDNGEPYTLDYMHKRFYAPSLGRFLSLDRSIGKTELPQSWNRYLYALDNPIRLIDPDGNDPKDSKIIHVRVNVIYSNADRQGFLTSSTLRQRTEAGLMKARQHYAEMGIALNIQRYEGTVILNDKGLVNGAVSMPGGPVMLDEFILSQKGRALNMMATPDIPVSGGSSGTKIVNGVPLWTILGASSNWKDAEHEMAHSFGNTMGAMNDFNNAVTDFIWFAERTQHDLFPRTIGFTYWFEQEMREGAAKLEDKTGGQ